MAGLVVAGSWFGSAWISTSPWPITVLGLLALGFILWLMLFKPF
jgi:hypothetical protein